MCALKTSNEMEARQIGMFMVAASLYQNHIPGKHVRTQCYFKANFNELDQECVSDVSVCICIERALWPMIHLFL